jgi:methyltransferase
VLVGAFLEVAALNRPFIPAIGYPALIVFALCNVLRWWVIRSLAGHWNVKVVDSSALGVVTRGPYRYVRHPNYTAVFLELLVIPLVHTAIITAVVGTLLHLWVLYHRIRTEERVLLANAAYRTAMGAKPRFIPGLF